MRIIVVGAGIAAMASAASLAKQGHQVVVLERSTRPGGRFAPVEQDGFGWDGDPSGLTLPATLRDLFRKSGRPVERVLDLALRPVARRHVFADGTSADLPTGSRGAQIAALDAGLGDGTGAQWAGHVDGQASVWDVLRRTVLDAPDASSAERRRGSVAETLTSDLDDRRLLTMAAWPVVRAGLDPRDAPAHLAVASYVERTFGVWDADGGNAALVGALVRRLDERRVELRCSTSVVRIATGRDGRVTGAEIDDGSFVDADVVVSGLDAAATVDLLGRIGGRKLRRSLAAEIPVEPPATTHLGLRSDPSDTEAPRELVLHGEPTVVVSTGGTGPPGTAAWTVRRYRGVDRSAGSDADVLDVLAERGLDLRDRVLARVDRAPAAITAETGSASYGLVWADLRAYRRHLTVTPAVGAAAAGLYLVGPSGHPANVFAGVDVAAGLWSAATVASLMKGRP